MSVDAISHAAHIDAWMDGGAKSLQPAELVTLFERALTAVWQRAESTLGEVTLTAIIDRVLYTATEKYPFISALKLHGSGFRFDDPSRQMAAETPAELVEGVRFVLVELLTVIGNLTDEILTPALHDELSKVTLDAPKRSKNEAS